MSILNKLLGKEDISIKNYSDFWIWFKQNSDEFYKVVKSHKDVDENFFQKIEPKLDQVKDGFFYLTGMKNDELAELVLTADGDTRNIAFVEELVAAAPKIDNWLITALKEPMDIEDVNIEMHGYEFNSNKIKFFYSEDKEYPDEIDITIVHKDMNKENEAEISNGCYIFLDNYLGELDFLNNIDNLYFCTETECKTELIPISKLKDFLTWKQKEFVEKYEGIRYSIEDDAYSSYERALGEDKKVIAIMNNSLLDWDAKASHPWMLTVKLSYDGNENNGLPNEEDYKLLNTIEDEVNEKLQPQNGYLNIGRETGDNAREFYIACKDFRLPSKTIFELTQKYAKDFDIEYDIYKDKYWRTLSAFM